MLKPTNGFSFDRLSSGSGSGGSHPLRYRSSECFEFDGEELGLENCPTSMSMPDSAMDLSPMHMRGKDQVASSLPPPSVLNKKALRITLPLEQLIKPVDPVTEEAPSSPVAPPPAKPKWKPSRKKAKPPEEPKHPTWNTSSNRRYGTYLDYMEETKDYRRVVQEKGDEVLRRMQQSGATRSEGVLRKKRVCQDPERAEEELCKALHFTIPPTVESLKQEGVGLRTLSALKGKYWYSIHTPLNVLKTYSLFMCSETDRGRDVHVTRHYLMKVAKRTVMDTKAWESFYLDLELLRTASHENCVSLVEVLQTETDVHMVVHPFMEMDVIGAAARGLSGEGVQKVVHGVASAFLYLHEKMGVAYCGLRGYDVLFDGETARLGDFSHIRCIAQDSPVSFSFKRVSRTPLESSHLITQDTISLGCLLHLLYYGSVPLPLMQDSKATPASPTPLTSLLKGTSTLQEFLSSPWLARAPTEGPAYSVDNPKQWVKEVRADTESLIKLLFSTSFLDRA